MPAIPYVYQEANKEAMTPIKRLKIGTATAKMNAIEVDTNIRIAQVLYPTKVFE